MKRTKHNLSTLIHYEKTGARFKNVVIYHDEESHYRIFVDGKLHFQGVPPQFRVAFDLLGVPLRGWEGIVHDGSVDE